MGFIDHQHAIHSRRTKSIARFWRRVKAAPIADCWEWPGVKTEDGYGKYGRWRAHVISWELNHCRPVPPGMQVCHHCDNPACINPWHLFIGTHQDNIDDKMKKGRHGCGRGPRPPIRGENHWTRKVDHSAKYAAIRAMLATGVSQREVARSLRVSPMTVRKVLRG